MIPIQSAVIKVGALGGPATSGISARTGRLEQQVPVSHRAGGWESEIEVVAKSGPRAGCPSALQMATVLLRPHVVER